MNNITQTNLIAELLNQPVPDRLFHYTNSEGLKGVISSGQIWATKIHYLNDKTELNLAFDYIATEIVQQKKKKYQIHTDDELDAMLSSLDYIQQFNVSVASFTERDDDLSQWRGYSLVGDGYSLGIDGKRLKNLTIINRKYILAPCVYDGNLHRQIARELVSMTFPTRSKTYPQLNHLTFAEAALFFAPLIKSKSFHDEREWRLISIPLKYDDAEFRHGQNVLIPYWRFDINIVDTLRSIVIGSTAEPKLSKMAVRGLCEKYNIFGPYEIKESKIPYRNM